MTDQNLQRTFFLVLLIAITGAFIWLIRGFLQPIFWAVALAIVFLPAHMRLVERFPKHRSLTAIASVLGVVLVVVLPILGLATAVTNEATTLYQELRSGNISLHGIYDQIAARLPQIRSALESAGINVDSLTERLSSSAISVSQFVASRALAIGQDTVRVTVYFFLTLYLLFFVLRDGRQMLAGLVRALPFGDEREHHLLEKFAEVSRATIKGTLVVGVVQGALGGIAFAVLGVGAPVLWGVVMALLSIIPAVGPALVWIPASIILFTEDRYIAAIVLILFGTLVIGLVDNLLRPILVGRDTRMPDYLILLSTLGGLTAFGLAGIVIGPIIAAFFLSVWEMAVEEFSMLNGKEEDAPSGPSDT
jgi:predicted PurR-regulated permease PerM